MAASSCSGSKSELALQVDDDSSTEPSETDSEELLIDPFELAGGVKEAFARLPLFRHCGEELIHKVADQAPRIKLGPDKVLDLQDGGPMYMVESGAVVVTLGSGPPVVLGPGSVFNIIGMLRLSHEAEPFRPKEKRQARRTKGYAYEIFGPHFNEGKAPPMLWTDRRRKGTMAKHEKGKATSNDVLCFYNVCPHAAAQSNVVPVEDGLPGWLPLTIVGARPEVVPTIGGDITFFRRGGASLCCVPLLLLEQVGCAFGEKTEEAVNLRNSLSTLKMNCAMLSDMWRTIMSRCSCLFPGVPPEVLWSITEMSERHEIEAGEIFVTEGTSGEAGESLILVDEGDATVEKMLGDVGRTRSVAIGRLGPGAIIGDLCLIGAGIPRAASVRAKSATAIITMSVQGILATIRQYPGMMHGLASHAYEVGNYMQLRLPQRLEVVSAQEAFSSCKPEFCQEVANNSEWRVFIGGQTIVSPGKVEEGRMYLLEYGRCALELEGQGQVEELPAGCAFGDARRLGLVVPAHATIRALTPLVITLTIHDATLLEAKTRHYAKERPPWEKRPRTPAVHAPRKMDYIISHIDFFSDCDRAFIRDLTKVVKIRGYLPGQTLFVEGAKDLEQQMFVIRGGETFTEQGGQRQEIPSKNTFGDLSMLGALHRRGVTVRAQTFCFSIEIPRSSFQEAIISHPEQRAQFENYAVQAMQALPDAAAVMWPFLGSAPFRFIYLLNLYAGHRLFKAGDPSLALPEVRACAVLVLQGTVAVINEEGEEVELLKPGECFNEQILLGIAGTTSEIVVPRTSCELQILPKEIWDNVMEEFPACQEKINSCLMTKMAEKAAFKCGVELNTPSVLRKAPLLRDVSQAFAEEMCKHLESLMIVPGMTICVEGKEGDRMLLLLRGKAYADSSSFGHVYYERGYIFGEAMLLGLRPTYQRTVYASNLCILQSVHVTHFLEMIERYPSERQMFSSLLDEAREHGVCRIDKQVKSTVAFTQATQMFVGAICEHAEDKFYARGEVIIQHGEKTTYGKSDMYAILRGHVRVEDELGVLLYYLEEGSVFGEAGALGLEPSRSIRVRASIDGFVHCARLVGQAVEAALHVYPEEREFLDEVHDRRSEARQEFTERRKNWLEVTVLPALAHSPLFLGCSPEFLDDLAAPLSQSTFEEGEVICSAGDKANSMLLLLMGDADVETVDGEWLGSITVGGVIGEIAVLGLFETSLATVRAASTPCHVLEVTASALERALNLESGKPVRAAFEKLKVTRQQQVEKGLPMCTLEIGADKDDTCVRSIALQAELVKLAPGETWEPLPLSDPCGAHFSVVQKGRAILEIPVPNLEIQAVTIMAIEKGYLLMESTAAEYKSQVRALSSCEIYRVRLNDYLTAISTVPTANREWQTRFVMIQTRMMKLLKERGNSAKGIINGLATHPHDAAIKNWGKRRQKALSNARPPGQLELWATQGSTLSEWSGLPHMQDFSRSFSEARLKTCHSSPDLDPKRREHRTLSSPQAARSSKTVRLPVLQAS